MKQRYRAVIIAGVIIILALICLLIYKRDESKHLDSITIGYRPTVVVDLALLMAIERGDFEKEGFDITLKPYGRADLLIAALKSGQLDGSVGIPLEPLLGMAAMGEYPVKGYLVWYFDANTPYDGFLVRQDSQFTSVDDLGGKVIGSHPSRQVTHFISSIVPNAKVKPYNPATPLLPLQSHDFDAIYVLEPIISQAVATGKYRLIETASISKRIFANKRVPAAISVLTSDWIMNNPNEAEKFVRFAHQVYLKDLTSSETLNKIQLLQKKEYGGYPKDVALRIVEPASSLPENLNDEDFERFLEKLRDSSLLSGQIDKNKLFYTNTER